MKRLKVQEVSPEFRESFILRGYRKPNSSFKSCIQSLFHLDNNEMINFWTHFLPFLYILYKLIKVCSIYDIKNDNFVWPLFIYLTTVSFYLLMSSLAHAFNSLSPVARHICFILDYLSISIYGMGSSIAYKSYTLSNLNNQMRNKVSDRNEKKDVFDYYVWLSLCITLCGNVFSCMSRFIFSHTKRKALRAFSFTSQYIFINLPLIYKLIVTYYPFAIEEFNFLFHFMSSSSNLELHPNRNLTIAKEISILNKTSIQVLSNLTTKAYNTMLIEKFSEFHDKQSDFLEHFVYEFLFSNSSKTNELFKNEADIFYILQFFAALFAIIFYILHIPESLFPAKFDIIGQSHQLFHLFAFLCTWSQFIALKSDMKELIKSDHVITANTGLVLSITSDKTDNQINDLWLYLNIKYSTIPYFNFKLKNTYIMLFCLIMNFLILAYYYFKLKRDNPWKKHVINNGNGKIKIS